MESTKQSTPRDLLIIVGLLAVLVVPSLFTRDLWNPDEPRYMEVAREGVVMRQFLVPHLNGVPYPDKPPMFFWAAGLVMKLGMGFNAGRVLSALSCLATLLAVYFFTRRFVPGVSPLMASLAMLSVLLFTLSATLGVIDPVLTTLVTGALMCGYAALHAESGRTTRWWLGAYGLAGLSVLTKGPVGFILPALVLLVYALLSRRQVRAGGRSHAWGALLFAGIVLAWLVPAAMTGGPEYARAILIKQNLGRVMRSYSHRRPPYYYLVRLPFHYFPWVLFLPFAAWAALKERGKGQGGPGVFAAVWVLVYLAFFSLVSGKRMGYILPIAPALGILAVWYPGRPSGGPQTAAVRLWVHRIAFGLLALLAVALVAGAALARPILTRIEGSPGVLAEVMGILTPAWYVCVISALLLPAVVACIGLVRAAKGRRVDDRLLAATIVLLMAVALPCIGSVVNVYKSGKLFCEEAKPYVAQARVVHLYPQDYSGVYNLYTGRVRMPVIQDEEALREALARPGILVIGQRKSLLKVFTPDELTGLTLVQRNVGHRKMLLLGTAPGEPPG